MEAMASASRPPSSDASTSSAPAVSEDVILPHARTEDGGGLHVLRKRGDTLEAGIVRATRDGQPLHGELLQLTHREGTPLFDVEVLHATPTPRRGRPPKVATQRFRDGWDRIWGEPTEDDEPS